jgi:hypothetical protein
VRNEIKQFYTGQVISIKMPGIFGFVMDRYSPLKEKKNTHTHANKQKHNNKQTKKLKPTK